MGESSKPPSSRPAGPLSPPAPLSPPTLRTHPGRGGRKAEEEKISSESGVRASGRGADGREAASSERAGRGRPSPWEGAEGGLRRPRPGEGSGVRVSGAAGETGGPGEGSGVRGLPPEIADRIRQLPPDRRETALDLATRAYGTPDDPAGSPPPKRRIRRRRPGDVEEFLDQRTASAPGRRVPVATLFDAYADWCRRRGGEPLSKKRFGETLNRLGVPVTRSGGRRYRAGISLVDGDPAGPAHQPANRFASSSGDSEDGPDLDPTADADVADVAADPDLDPTAAGAPPHLRVSTARWWLDVRASYPDLDGHLVMILTAAAEAWDRSVQARLALDARGRLTYENSVGNRVPYPEVVIEERAKRLFAHLVRELALDLEEPDDDLPPLPEV